MRRMSLTSIQISLLMLINFVLVSCGYYRGEIVSLAPPKYNIILNPIGTTFDGMAAREGNTLTFQVSIDDNHSIDRNININLTNSEGKDPSTYFENFQTVQSISRGSASINLNLKVLDDYLYRGDSDWTLQITSQDQDLNSSLTTSFIILEDEVRPRLTLSPTTPYYINSVNQSSFTIQGTCSYEGGGVILTGSDGIHSFMNAVICTSGAWSKTFNFSSYIDGLISVHIKHSDTTNTYETESDFTFFKRTTLPTAPTGMTLFNPTQSPSTNNSPQFNIQGVDPGDTVKFYSGSTCSQLYFESVISTQNNNVTLPGFSQYGSYVFSIIRVDPFGNPSTCLSAATIYSFSLEFNVISSANPNTSDANIGDGVCANSNGECSFKAALDEANYGDGTSLTEYWGRPAIINIQSGTYVLSSGSLNIGPTNTSLKKEIYISGVASSNTVIDGNSQSSLFLAYSSVIFKNLTFKNATSCCNLGSVLSTFENSTLTLENTVFESNSGSNAEGIVFLNNVSKSNITNSTFKNNSGSAISSYVSSSVTVKNSNFENNTGTAIYQSGVNGYWKIDSSLIASNGTGVSFSKCSKCYLINSTIFNNSAYGLKFYFDVDINEDLFILNSTLYNNATSSGNNIEIDLPNDLDGYDGRVRFINSIIAVHNGSHNNCGFSNVGRPVELLYSIFDDNTCGSSGTSIQVGVDPLLGPLASNGGPTQSLAPLSNSPAINNGDNTLCEKTDQRGYNRPVGVCDIGSIEKQ